MLAIKGGFVARVSPIAFDSRFPKKIQVTSGALQIEALGCIQALDCIIADISQHAIRLWGLMSSEFLGRETAGGSSSGAYRIARINSTTVRVETAAAVSRCVVILPAWLGERLPEPLKFDSHRGFWEKKDTEKEKRSKGDRGHGRLAARASPL